MADQVAGAEHFRTTVQTGIRDHEGAAGLDQRPRQPVLRDRRAGRRGKIPILPEYVISMNDEEVVLRNFRGQEYVYRQPREDDALVASFTPLRETVQPIG